MAIARLNRIKGPKGDDGKQGPIGPKGPKGDKGDRGETGPQGSTGFAGPAGATGPAGADGADGVGVPVGGTAGQVLAKIDGTDYNTEWVDITGGLEYQGTWNASTNTPTIVSATGTNGYYYVVDVAGTTSIDGVSDWGIGDWIIFNGANWQKVDNSEGNYLINSMATNKLLGRYTAATGVVEEVTLGGGLSYSGSTLNALPYIKTPVEAATTTALTVTSSGVGVGQTLTNAGAQAALVIDGVTMTLGERVLVKDQATANQNGIYVVTDVGSVSTNWVLTRATDCDGSDGGAVTEGMQVMALRGGTNTAVIWIQTRANPITVGVNSLLFSGNSAASVTGYAKLDGTNQPFTGNLRILKSNPRITLADTATNEPTVYLEKLTTLDGSQLVSQNRLYSIGNALNLFGGTSGTGLSYTSTGALSLAFWWKTTNAGDSYFIGNSSATSDFRWGSGVISFQDEAAGLARYWNAPSFNNGVWRHIALTISADRATVLCYINGVAATQVQAGTVGGNFVINRIFSTNGTSTASFDEFIIYDKTLSAGEVAALYASGTPSEITDLTNVYAYYKLNATSGTTATDSSGNGRNVTLSGGSPTWSEGIVSPGIQSLSDVPIYKIVNNTTSNSYGDLTFGYYSTTRGTSNIFDGLSHTHRVLGASKMTITSSGVNISQYTGNLAVGGAFSATTTIAAGSALSATTTVSAGTYFWGSAGLSTDPTYSFTTDKDTGAYSGGANVYNIATGGTLRLTIDGLGRSAWGTSISSAIFSRYSYSPTQLGTGTTVIQSEGTHTQNANNNFGFVGYVASVGLNSAGFDNTISFNSGGGLSGYYGLVQASSTPATGTVTALVGARMSVRNTGGAAVTEAASFFAMPILNSGAGSITNAYGFYSGVMAAATNNYGFYGVTTAAANRWNVYMAGSAQNYFAGSLGIGVTVPTTKLHVIATSDPFRVGYDAGDYFNMTVSSTGAVVMTATGSNASLAIGSANTDKISLFGAVPDVQPTTAITGASYTHNSSTAVHTDDTWDGYTIGQIVAALRRLGALA